MVIVSLLLAVYAGAMVGMGIGILAVYRKGEKAPPGSIVAYLLLALMGGVLGGALWAVVR